VQGSRGIEKGEAMSKVVHFEIPADDPERAVAFYREVLGWESSRFGDIPYWLVQAGHGDEPGADGAISARDEIHRAPVVIASVEDIAAALARVRTNGGVIVQEQLPIPGMGWSAYFQDPEGNTVGLFQSDPGAGLGG
jgi:predicted enzyme related to lactoylglutathione lyase